MDQAIVVKAGFDLQGHDFENMQCQLLQPLRQFQGLQLPVLRGRPKVQLVVVGVGYRELASPAVPWVVADSADTALHQQ
jgi:hypothetical protein